MKLHFLHRGTPLEIEIEGQGAERTARIGETTRKVAPLTKAGPVCSLLVDGKPVRFLAEKTSDGWAIAIGGELHVFTEGSASQVAAGAKTASPETRAPIPGKVMKLETKVGAAVAVGAPLVILEAMKMENVLSAEVEGRVAKLHVAVGDMVQPGQLLVEIEPPT